MLDAATASAALAQVLGLAVAQVEW